MHRITRVLCTISRCREGVPREIFLSPNLPPTTTPGEKLLVSPPATASATGGSGGKFDGSRQGDNNTCVVWPTLESAKSAPTQNAASEARSGEGGEIEIPTHAVRML